MVEAEVFDGTSYLRVVFFNQALARAAAAGGHRGRVLREGRVPPRSPAQMTNPIVDVLDRGRREHRRDRAGLPAVGEGRRLHVAAPQARRARASRRRKPRGFADPLDAAAPRRPRARRPRPRAYRGIHRPEAHDDHRRAAQRLKFDEFLRMQVGLVARKRALEQEQTGHPARGRRPARASRSTAGCRSSSTGDQQRAIDEIFRDLAGAGADAPAAPGRRRLGQDRRRAHRAARRRAGRLPGRAHGADRGAGRAALPHVARASSRGSSVASEATLVGERPVRVELLTNRTGAADRRRIADGLQRRRGRHRRRHARADLRRGRVRPPRRRRDRRAAPLRRRAARAAARAWGRSPTCSS